MLMFLFGIIGFISATLYLCEYVHKRLKRRKRRLSARKD